MIRTVLKRLFPALLFTPVVLGFAVAARAQDGPPRAENPDKNGPVEPAEVVPGQFFPIIEPIDGDLIERTAIAARQVIDRARTEESRPVLVFEIRPGTAQPGKASFGTAWDLANVLSTRLAGARTTVAYIPEPLTGYAVLAALACDEIVMAPGASLGPITPEGEVVDQAAVEPLKILARRKGREPDLLLGMLDKEADLRAVRADNKQVHYVLAQNLAEFKASHVVLDDQPAWEGGRRGVLSAERARDEGFVKLLAENPSDVANAYRLAGQASGADPTLGQVIRPVWIEIEGTLDSVKESYLRRRIEQARQEKANLIFFAMDSDGGIDKSADNIADLIVNTKDMKTVAFVDGKAMGVAILVALACDDVVFLKGARMGDVRRLITGRRGQSEPLSDLQISSLASRAETLARQNGHPSAVARAMVDPESIVLRAKDHKTGAVVYVLRTQVEAEPARYTVDETIKDAGDVLTVTGEDAASFGLGQVVNDREDFKGLYGLRGKTIKVDGPTWVDGLVTTLNDPFVSWIVLFVGLFMLVLELKLPGIGLPAITSALAFMLFFWSRYLSGTADQLEIMLFVIGMACLAMELFVFPGFGVFGMSGILLILVSIVMASHTFIWPTQEYEYRQLGQTLLQMTLVLGTVGGGAVALGRYFPSMPIFNRLILKPEPWDAPSDPTVKPSADGMLDSLTFLIGETGRTTSVLRPSGKARFGELLVDVSADGFYIERDRLVEVVEVQGSRVIVKAMGS
ncbi:NfeD family protein [Isosphaeraceae bacterium EP7]